jgi:sec-independent protein translocase protein TatC
MIVVFISKGFVFDKVVFAPCSSDFLFYRWLCALDKYVPLANTCIEPFKIQLININLSSQFFVHLSTSFWIALVLGFPYLIWELWRFISPALYQKEQRSVRFIFLFASVLFYAGAAVAYLMIFPLTLQFFWSYQLSPDVPNQISLQSYIDTLVPLVLVMGLVFELPVLVNILSRIGLINRAFLRKYRRHAIVVLLVLAAIVTPADIFSMIMAAIPLYLLFELSILTCKA